VGSRFPIDRCATGRSILAALPESEQRLLCGARLTDELSKRLTEVADAGVDSTAGDPRSGIVGLGAAIFGADHAPVAALALYGPEPGVKGLTDTRSEIAGALRRTSDAIGFAIGGPRNQPLAGV
jgi:DNA-binding IclR family transcriptional regulator